MSPVVSRETTASPSCCQEHAVSRETPVAPENDLPNPLVRLVLVPLRAYRRYISPALTPRCRYYPSCSAYAEESIRELGAVRGTILAGWRLLRCGPWTPGGYDPVPPRD